MTLGARLLILLVVVLTGCARAREKARDVAVTSFRVIDAPANYVRRKIDEQDGGATTTTTTTETTVASSDVVRPGRPLPPRSQTPPGSQPNTAPRPPLRDTAATSETTPPPQGSSAPPAAEFPTARPVPGKPGYVYSVDPKGGIVDVTGYKSGDKAKDPYTQQIFIVP